MSALGVEAAVIENPYILIFAMEAVLFLQYLLLVRVILCESEYSRLISLSIVDIEGGGNAKNIEIIERYILLSSAGCISKPPH